MVLPQSKTPKIAQPQKTVEDRLKELDDLLKRNNGTGLFVGQDTSSNLPMYIPGKVTNPGGIGAVAPSIAQAGNGMTQQAPVQRTQPPQSFQPIQQQDQPPDQQMSAEDFIQQFNDAYNQVDQTPGVSTDPSVSPSVEGIATLADGGILGNDGMVYYDDGTVREFKQTDAQPIASMQDGSILYSDRTLRRQAPQGIASLAGDRERVLFNDGTARFGKYNQTQQNSPGGLRGLISGIFGQDRTITQPYGNVNPIEPTRGHVNYGTDIRTRDLSGSQRDLKLPVDAKVVQVLLDDGTRFGDQSGHMGYGNSLLLQLPSGEMVRFSHLSQILNVKTGETITAGESFGTPGTTGNTTGEHLDLEYYNANGKIDNPNSFSGFTNPVAFRDPSQPAPGTIDASYQNPRAQQHDQLTQVNQSVQQSPNMSASMPMPAPVPQAQGVPTPQQLAKPLGNQVADAIDKANPTGNFGLGLSELVKNDPQAAAEEQRNTISNIGTVLGAPNLNTKALSSEQGTNPFRQLAGNIVDSVSTPFKKLGLPETGVSEAIAGGKTVNTDIKLAPTAFAADGLGQPNVSRAARPQDYAGVLGKNIKDVVDPIGKSISQDLSKAGQGVSGLAQDAVSSLQNVFKPTQVQAKRAVGDVPGTSDQSGNPSFSSLQDTAQSLSTKPNNDIRDNFFKMGGADTYKSFLKPGVDANYSGALTTDLFNNDFFTDPNNIGTVFGHTSQGKTATDKYRQTYLSKIVPGHDSPTKKYSEVIDGERYEWDDVDPVYYDNQYWKSVADSVPTVVQGDNIFASTVKGSAKPKPSAGPAPISQKTTIALPSKPTAPSLSGFKPPTRSSSPGPSGSSPSQNYSPAKANFSSPSGPTYVAPKKSSSPTPSYTPAKANFSSNVSKGPVYVAPKPAPAPVSRPTPKPAPAPAPRPSPKPAPKPQSAPSNNIFSAVKKVVSNIFRR